MASGQKSGGHYASGSFVGAGEKTVTLPIDFEPDVVAIKARNLDAGVNGWYGYYSIVIVRNVTAFESRHNNATMTTLSTSCNPYIGGTYPPFGAQYIVNNYGVYGTFANGEITITNTVQNGATSFLSGETYDWQAWART